LLSDSTIQSSLTSRPIWQSTYQALTKEIASTSDAWWAQSLAGPETDFLNFFKAGIYQPVLTNTYNTALPYGDNNGTAWYGKGLNNVFQGGFLLTYDYVPFHFRSTLLFTQIHAFPS